MDIPLHYESRINLKSTRKAKTKKMETDFFEKPQIDWTYPTVDSILQKKKKKKFEQPTPSILHCGQVHKEKKNKVYSRKNVLFTNSDYDPGYKIVSSREKTSYLTGIQRRA